MSSSSPSPDSHSSLLLLLLLPFLFTVCLFFYLCIRIRLFSRWRTRCDITTTRRKRAAFGCMIVFLIVVFLLIHVRASTWLSFLPSSPLSIEHITISINNLPIHLDGLVILHLSDIHWIHDMPRDRRAQMAQIIHHVAEQHRPDLILITGDLIHYHASAIDDAISSFLRPLQLQSHNGQNISMYVSFGNHEYRQPGALQYVKERLIKEHIHVLHNSIAYPIVNDTSLILVGLADHTHEEIDVDKIFSPIPPNIPRIVMAHNPDAASTILLNYRADLILAGHTHGGLIHFPSFSQRNRGPAVYPMIQSLHQRLPRFLSRWLDGYIKIGAGIKHWEHVQGYHRLPRNTTSTPSAAHSFNQLYVSRGLADLIRRVFCDPEITYITLRTA